MSKGVAEVSASYLVETNKEKVPVGYKKTEVGIIPGAWKVHSILDLTTEVGDGIHSTPEYSATGSYYFINGNNIADGSIVFFSDTKTVSFVEFKKHKKPLNDRTLLLSINGTIGNIGFYRGENIVLGKSAAYLNFRENINKSYAYYALQTRSTIKSFDDGLTGTTIRNLGLGTIRNTCISVPNDYKEQTAIANALSDIDALITSLEKLIAKKRAIKTATMQQLLTGKKRLPPFDQQHTGYKQTELGEIPEDWEVVELIKLLKENPRYGIGAAAVPLVGKLPVYLRITDISEDGYFSPDNRVGVNRPESEDYILQRGDLVFARTGASVGKSYLYRESDGKLVYAGFLIKTTPDSSRLNPEFFQHYVQTSFYWQWVKVNSMRSGQPGINGAEYGKMLVPLPEVEEQSSIAKILSNMEEEIKSIEKCIDKTKQLKQGMMQELLTGKTRLLKEA